MKFYYVIKYLLLFSLFPFTLSSQEIALSSLLIPQDLKENANAVIRFNEEIITIEAIDKMVVSKRRIVTVLNTSGDSYVHAYTFYNNDQKISKLSATVYNAFGEKIRKYSKSKFLDESAVAGGTLYSDSRVKRLDYTPRNYPYTIEFISEVKNSSTGFIEGWYPVEGFATSTQKSIYKIINPKKLVIRTKEKHFEDFPIVTKSTENTIHYILNNQNAIRYENYAPRRKDFLPVLMVGLNEFSIKGDIGKAKNWKEFGKWQYDHLISKKENLPIQAKQKVLDLVKNTNDTLEKAKLVYEYMQNRTRYISVQVGIGGLSPDYASEVDKLGYGDCKGLTNYTKELLKAVGVKSYYTEVYAGKSKINIDTSFHSIEGDHIILNLPYKGKDYWLECTSQTMPFGFLGDFTDDRDVLVMTPEGGIIKHTPAYKNEDNLQQTTSNINIDLKGNINSQVIISTTGTQYNYHYSLENYDSSETLKYYKSQYWKSINNLSIKKSSFTNDKDKVQFIETVDLQINNYASFAGENLLISVNVFNKYIRLAPKRRTRKLPIEIQRGFKDTDTNIFTIPKEYIISNLPEKKIIKTDFGTYKVALTKIDEYHFEYQRSLLIKAGMYPKESYEKYRAFLKSITKYDNLRIALIKK
tara:strand:+ start:32362 stop:34278 length:1917 start_codon:yes stop_codon:yes gene_type:complete